MILKARTGNGEPGTGVWERVYSVNPHEKSNWRKKEKKKALLRTFKFTGKRKIILKIPSYFDFCIVYNFIE